MMDIEDQIAKIIKDEYAADGYEDEGHSTAAAHDIMVIVNAEIRRLQAIQAECHRVLNEAGVPGNHLEGRGLPDRIRAAIAGK